MDRNLCRQMAGLLLACCLLPGAVSCSRGTPPRVAGPTGRCGRIISFAPSITETLFALGLGEQVVGVTRFCTYPPQVKVLPRIGGYLDPNYEMVLSLKPDVVFTLKEHAPLIQFLEKNGIGHVSIDNENLEGIISSFREIGGRCGHGAQAESLVTAIDLAMTGAVKPPVPPRILLCVGRDNPGGGAIAKIFAAGPKTFYSQLINKAGGVNVFTDSAAAYPSLSAEGIARLAPDVIVDVMASVSSVPEEKIRQDWYCLTMVPAIEKKMVFCMTGDYGSIPGPRIALILRDLVGIMKQYVAAASAAPVSTK